uniref:Uncharacterized protein n=1 Tax=Meloidogyne enterolobii TaxID=390850 RepID=A0A6V7V8L3_MELEN|nr:unnamed protein product [Meloidogyne enterolobii]
MSSNLLDLLSISQNFDPLTITQNVDILSFSQNMEIVTKANFEVNKIIIKMARKRHNVGNNCYCIAVLSVC